MFPHHENESAQACCRWHEPLANLWMHTGMLRVDGEKMSKSLGNFHTLKEVLDRYPADAVRLLMLQTHYRSSLDFSFERLDGCVGALERLRTTARNLRWAAENSDGSSCGGDAAQALSDAIDAARDGFTSAMDDDFNTSSALAAVFSLANQANAYLDAAGAGACTSTLLRASDTLVELLEVLGLESVRPQADPLPAGLVDVARDLVGFDGDDVDGAVAALVDARAAARAAKDWARADAIRDAVSDLGLVVEDTQAGTRITRQEGGR